MKRFILTSLTASLALLSLAVLPASAQFTYPFQPPRFGPGYQTQLSPYLNLLRGGDPAANYYIGVVPEFQRRQDRNMIYGTLQGMQNQLPAPPRVRETDIDQPLPSTGHPTAFGYTGSYFGGPTQGARSPGNPFAPRQGSTGRWPSNKAAPPGKPPAKQR
jgi:hypothetical protein